MSEKWWEEDSVADQEQVLATVSPGADEEKWWEQDQAFREDASPKFILSSIEADRKRAEEQALLDEAHASLEKYGEIPAVASQVVTDTAAVAERLLGMGDRADEVSRKSAILDQAMRERDAVRWQSEADPKGMSALEQAGQYVPFLKQGVRGAARSLGTAVLGAKGAGAVLGPSRAAYGAIGLASAQEANRAITEGADAGLEGSALASYVASQGVIEALPATVMQRVGLGGVEAMVAGPAIRGGIKAGIIEAVKRTGQEIPEELVTEVGHAVATEYAGVDRQALDSDRLASLVADTVLQTVLMGAGAGAVQGVAGAVAESQLAPEQSQRLKRLQEMQAKGFISEEDAKKENIPGATRKERMANAQKEIDELQKPPPELPGTPPGAVQPTGQQIPPRLTPGAPGTTPAIPGPSPQQPPQEGRFPTVGNLPPSGARDDLRDVGKAGGAIVDNFYEAIGKSLKETGKVPGPERKSSVGRAWDAWQDKTDVDGFVDSLRSSQGAPNASEVQPDAGRDEVQGNAGKESQVDSGSQVRQPGQVEGGTQPKSEGDAAPEVPVDDKKLPALQPGVVAEVDGKGQVGIVESVTQDGVTLVFDGNEHETFAPERLSTDGWQDSYTEDEKQAVIRGTQTEVTPTKQAGSPTVSPDAPETGTRMGETAGDQPSETNADNTLELRGMLDAVNRRIESQGRVVDDRLVSRKQELERLLAESEAKSPEQSESKWQAETRSKLASLPALKEAKIETDEKAGTANVTRPDGAQFIFHLNHDKELAEAAQKKGRDPKAIHGWYVRNPGESVGRIYIRSDADFTNIASHELFHGLEDLGVVTKEEVEKLGGREAAATKFGKWAASKQRAANPVFKRIREFLEPLLSSQSRFFEEVGKRKAPKPGWKLAPQDGISITESPDLKLETSRREKADPQFPIDVGSPVTVYRRGSNGKEEMQEGVVEDTAESMPGNIKVRLSDGSLVTPLMADVGPARSQDTAPVPQQPEGGDPATTTAEQVPPIEEDDFTAKVNAAFDERFKEPTGDAETAVNPPKKGRKRKDPPSKPTLTDKAKARKERTAAVKAEKLAKFKDLLKQKKITAGFDPELATAAVELTAAAIDDGVSTFAEYVAWIADNIGDSATRKIAPYLEAGWKRLGTYDKFRGKIDSAGKVADVLGEMTKPAQARIAARVRDALGNGEELTSQTFFAIADEEFGGTRANNAYGDSQATDALELGVNLYLQGKTDAKVDPERAKAILGEIQQVMQLVPRHRGRTGNKDRMQQFSTPPAYAYAVNWIANVTDADVVLEPSAGMGGIAIHAINSGATVYGNELDPARAEGLRELPMEQVFTEDAEQIGAILKGKMPGLNVIIMNPPFSRAGMRMGDRMVQGTDRKHIDEALTLLPDGGRLVAIVGAGLHGQGTKMTQWLDNIPYQLTANIEVARNVYRGYGTEFPTRVLVIDKVPRTSKAVSGVAGDLSELIDLAEEVRNARVERNAAQPNSPQSTAGDGEGTRPTDDARGSAGTGVSSPADSGAGTPAGGQRGTDRGDSVVNDDAATGGAGADAGGRRGGRSGGGKTGKSGRSSKGPKAKSTRSSSTRKSDGGRSGNRGTGLTKVTAKSQPRSVSAKTELGESTFEVYTPSVVVDGAKPHPAPIVESAAMAAVDAPTINYDVDVMPGVFEGYVNDDGIYVGISDIQLEAIAMAGAAHEQMLPSGERRGFLIGDGTGVGKAREALGIIMDDFIKRGTGERRKAVFITKNDGLVKDAVNEWAGVGGDTAEMQPLSNVGSGTPVSYDSGVLTLSYDTLKGEASAVAKSQGNTLSRVEQIVEWVGDDFDGVVVFDEAHLMANSMDTGTGNQTRGASMRALAGVDLQQRLPNARFVYLSATAATEVRNLAYAERLGLWGPGTAFDSKHRFVSEIEAGGVAAMEKVAADMKAMGMYVARNLSFDDGTPNGRVEFDRIQHTLSSDQRRVYDKLSEAWLRVLANIDEALEITNNERGKSRILSAFWSANQRFWNDVVTTMMAPTLIQNIEKDLEADRSVVIQLSTTKEAATSRAIAGMREGQTYDEIDASPRRSLMEYVERAFPTQRHETYIDDSGNERTRPVVDSEGNPVHDPAAVAMKERLLDEIGSLDVAARGPIDMIIDHFGKELVAEISGRSQRLVKGDDGRLELEKRGKAAARADRDSFMDGKKRVLLFSEAGGTGASYHASLSVANQQRRSHYLWQPGWSAPVAVQGLGRAHRSNQASAPILHLLEPNMEGYKRFISTIARRLGQLGALTKGQRTAADAGLFGANDNLESTEANSALFQFMRDAVDGNIDGIDRDFLVQRLGLEQLAGDVAPTPEMFSITQFLNRMLNLPLGEQNQVFREFQSRMDSIVQQAIQDGTLDQGMETLKAEKIVKANETIVNEHETGAKTKLVELTLTHKTKLKTFEDMLREASGYGQSQFSLHGFVKSKTSGKVFAVVDQNRTSQDANGNTLHDAMFIGVDGNSYGHSLEKIENAQYWEQLPRDQARDIWEKQFSEAPTTRESTMHLLTGALLPVWNKIPGENSRVLRALTTEGETILGRVIPERLLQRTLDGLGVSGGRSARQYTPLEGIQAIYEGGTVELANGWKIKKRMIDGEDNIEIIGPDYASTDGITNAGGFTRRIDYKTRFFIPFDDTQGEILGEITRISPIASITAPARGGGTITPGIKNPTRQSRTSGRRSPGESPGIAAADIQKTVESLFDVAVRQGGFSERAAGIYKWMTRSKKSPPSPEVVRTKEDQYASLATLSHEVAHHIDEMLKVVRNMPSAVKSEVKSLDYEPQKAQAFEGWAEFFRRYVTEPPIDVNGTMMPNTIIDAPQTTDWFEKAFLPANPELAEKINQFRDYAQQYANQSVFARIGTAISDRKPHDLRFKERWKQKSKRFINRLKSNFLDKFHTLEWIQQEARERGYKGTGIYDLTMAYFLSASSHATIAFEEGVRSLVTPGKQIGNTKLWELSRHLENDGEYDEAVRYALARHTLFMDAVKPGYNTGVDVEDAQAWVDEAKSLGKSGRYEKFAKELAQFNDDLLLMLVDAGALAPSEASKMINYYRDGAGVSPYYFPLHRVQDIDNSDFAGTSAGFVNLGSPVKGRTRSGSGRQIIDPLDATVTRAIKFYGRAIQARQAHTLAKTLDPKLGGVGGMGGLMDRVPAKRVANRGTIEEILNTLVASGTIDPDQARAMRIAARILDPGNGMASDRDLDWFAQKHNIVDWANSWADMKLAAESEPDALAVISLWRPDYTPSAQRRTVMIYDKNGNKLMYEMDDELYRVATGMQDVQFNGFMNILRESARYFKSGAVGLSTGFGTANLLRDYWEFQGKANHVKGLSSLGKPWQMLGRYVAEKTKKATGGKADDLLIRLYEESGGKVYSVIGHDAEGRSIFRRRKIGKSTMSKLGLSLKRPKDTAESLLDNMQELIAISDAPPRLADGEAALAEHGFVIRNGSWFNTRTQQPVGALPESALIAASVAMAEATINFKRIGAAGQYVEAFFPFFNATIQATYRQYRQIKNLKSLGRKTDDGRRALRTLVYMSALASTAVMYWLLRHDDDDYRNQDAWLRDGYWTWGRDGKTYVRIPKPRDFGVVGNVTENMLDAWYHDDSRETPEVLTREVAGRIPTGGGFIRGIGEAYIANYDYFRGRELEGEWMKDIPKQYRTSSYTSQMSDYLGKHLGETLNTSPIQFQHLLNSATGGMYGRLTDTYDAAQDGRIGPEHIPFARGLLIDRRQTRPIGEFYEKKEELEAIAATQKIEQDKVSSEVAGNLARFDWISEVMTALRREEGKLGKKRTFENEKYITGLARYALGYEEQESNPNPLTAKDLPEDIRKTVDHYRQIAVVGASESLGQREGFKSDETYVERKTQIERAETKFKSLGMTLEQAEQALLDYWEKTYGSVRELKNGNPVLKDAVRKRKLKLETLFQSE